MGEQDFLTDLGFLSFVTRLKRASDAMLHDGRKLYRELGMEIEPNWYVIFKLFQIHDQLTVTGIAEKIGFAHPSVIAIVNKMIKKGYLEASQCGVDNRRRLLVMTDKARKGLPEFERIWSAGTAGIKKMLADTDALAFLKLLESRINEEGFKRRTLKSLERQKKVKILEYESKYAKDFADLNYEWISEMYEVEEHDRDQLDDPESYVIDNGGQILLARIGNNIVGAVALIFMDPDRFELAKMAVTSGYRGHGIGKKLMAACIEYSRKAGKKSIVLESNRKQIPALKLYRGFGFKEIELDPNSPFERADIRMELKLGKVKSKKVRSRK